MANQTKELNEVPKIIYEEETGKYNAKDKSITGIETNLEDEKSAVNVTTLEKVIRADQGILPTDYEFDNFDRPDLIDINNVTYIEVDGDDYYIPNILLDDLRKLPAEYEYEYFDRPDIEETKIEVDSNYYIPNIVLIDKTQLLAKKYYQPDVVSAFNSLDSNLVDYAELISNWDAIMTKANLFKTYCIKTERGRSSTKDLPIYTYEFKPDHPKIKVLLTTGMHGSEKIYIKLMSMFFDRLVDNWTKDLLLEWLRLNVHFIIIPCLNPSAIEGLTSGTIGGRRAHETDPFPVSWTKTGNTVTLTYQESDFPDTNGRLDGSAYFNNPNIVGKTWFNLIDCSDTVAVPTGGYVIGSVVNGKTITFETPLSSTASGTARIYCGVDINRNMQADTSTIWDTFTPSTVLTQYSNDYGGCPNDNKGTKPFSLSESIVLKDLITNNPDVMFYADFHSGAGNNYLHWSHKKEAKGQSEAIEELKDFQSTFNSDGFNRVVQDAVNVPYSYAFCVEQIDKQGYSLEWQQLAATDSQNATDAMRWMSQFLISFVRNLK